MSLARRDAQLRELMDDPHCDPARLAETLRRFDAVNRVVSGWGRVWRHRLAPALRQLGRPARVLDLGSGGGDVVRRLAALAVHDGIEVSWVGADPDPRALDVARERARADVEFRCADSGALRAAGERFDAVISNHVLHHLSPSELRAFADDSLHLAAGPVLHADIERGRTAYALYAAGITVLERGTFLRVDGLRSIRRSYRSDELAAALRDAGASADDASRNTAVPHAAAWHVERPAPFRLLAVGAGHA